MGFKLRGIKQAGSTIKNLDLNVQKPLRSLGDNVFKRTLRNRKAITTDQARKEKNDPTLDPYGATFQPSDTGLSNPYSRSRYRLVNLGDAITQEEEIGAMGGQLMNRGFNVLEKELIDKGEPVETYKTEYHNVVDPATGRMIRQPYTFLEKREFPDEKYDYTPEQREKNRLNLGIKFASEGLEKQARQSAKISKNLADAYAAVVRGDITPDDYMQVINDQATIAFGDKEKDPLARGNQNYAGADEDAFNLTRDQLMDYYQLAKDARAAEDLTGYINEAQGRLITDERDGEFLTPTSTTDYLESLRPTALDERSGNFLVDGSGLMMRAAEEDVAERYKKTKK